MSININLTPQLEQLVREKISTGRYPSASEVVRETLRLMEEQGRLRAAKLDQCDGTFAREWKAVKQLPGTWKK